MDYNVLGTILPRYVRQIGSLTRNAPLEIGFQKLTQMDCFPVFHCMPGYRQLGGIEECKNLGLYPMDAASYLAIVILNLPRDRVVSVLDLCCCPGSKLLCLAEELNPDSLVVGVDLSTNRLNVCRSLMMAWDQPSREFCRDGSARKLLFHADGTTFGPEEPGLLLYDSCLIDEEVVLFGGIKKRNKSYRERESKRLKQVQETIKMGNRIDEGDKEMSLCVEFFDFVLVDAECTHDASYRHMKFINTSMHEDKEEVPIADIVATSKNTSEASLGPAELAEPADVRGVRQHTKPRAALSHESSYHGSHAVPTCASPELTTLQRGLILNGFRRLRPGGCLVYSTCSRDPSQNEEVVRWLLQTAGAEAELLHVPEIIQRVCSHNCASSRGIRNIRRGAVDTAAAGAMVGDSAADSAAHSVVPSLSPTPALEFMNRGLPELHRAIQAECPSEEQQHALADALCREVAGLPVPVFVESSTLPGTVSVDHRGGMSGHFIAKIRKTTRGGEMQS